MNLTFIDFVFNFFTNIRSHNVNIIYEGEISHEIIKAFTSLAEKDLKARKEANPTKKKVFNIMVECLQNISKHADCLTKTQQKNGRGILLVSENDKQFIITTGNVVKVKSINKIEQEIDNVNSLTKEQLRVLFKQKLSTGRLSKKEGAGLGFIDMKRKSNNKLEYNFKSIDSNYSFFILNAFIDK